MAYIQVVKADFDKSVFLCCLQGDGGNVSNELVTFEK